MQQEETFWNDIDKAQRINKKVSEISDVINNIDSSSQNLLFVEEMLLLENVEDKNQILELDNLLQKTSKNIEEIFIQTLFKEEFDNLNAVVQIHSGAGGTESCDWVQILSRMYFMYAQKNNFKVEILDSLYGDTCGLKSISFKISGKNVYGLLSAEKGVHRLVRISPFDSNKRRHTTFASVDVMPLIENDLDSIVLDDKDLKIDTFRSSGAGGQHVNTTDSAVRITYLPLNIVVSCQNERSQLQNKQTCLQILKSKLMQKQIEERQEKLNQIKGTLKKIEWGSQIRSYVFCPYTLVKDHRTDFEKTNVESVLNGDIDEFILEYLKRR